MVLIQYFVRQTQGYSRLILLRSRHPCASTLPHRSLGRKLALRCCIRRDLFSDIGRCENRDEFEECWGTTSHMVNPNCDSEMDTILQGLNSPAPQSFYILQRAMKEISKADATSSFEDTVQECGYLIKPGWQLVVSNPDHLDATKLGWKLLPLGSEDDSIQPDSIIAMEGSGGPNACQLSSQALSMVSKAADSQQPLDTNALDDLVVAMERRLRLTLGTDIRGRTSADMAFNMCLAGIDNEFLYSSLVKVAKLEMERVGQRPSRRARDVLHVVEKLAASGIKGPEVAEVYQLAAKSLQTKDEYPEVVKHLVSPGSLDLLSQRPLLWLWRYSSRLQKPAPKESLPKNLLLWKKFDDISRPLVADIGCGLGVSLLGLASQEKVTKDESSAIPLDWSKCNYFGGDLSEATVRFANTIARRWNLSNKVQYAQMSAESFLDDLSHYPGPISLIMIQFPSPWRLKKSGGNSQLPSGPDDENFMVSKALMAKIADVLRVQTKGDAECYFLLQTNCEDVALVLRDRAKEFGMILVPSMQPVTRPDEDGQRIPGRTIEWLKLYGNNVERAVGDEWSSAPLLPPKCATETEVACILQDSPVHRCLFKVEQNQSD